MSTAPKYNPSYTVYDYQTWQGDWELYNGVAIAMGPSPFGPPQSLAPKIATELIIGTSKIDCSGFDVLQEIDWIVNDNTVVRPDLLIVADGVPAKHVETCPVLIVEILSDSTEEKDRHYKFELYQGEGVKFYLLADPQEKQVELFELMDGKYHEKNIGDRVDIRLSESCQLSLDVGKFFE
jgi:Uma2 family endonuclease